ncbi:MAG: hypothetical protein IBJ12_14905, partial [Sphingomonadaceae bacterium]|nr:hypothetical protein [Sphingomonadaceae bacterium]
ITIEDDRPVVGENATVVLDDDAKANGNPLGDAGTDDADPQNATGTLSGSGGDGALTWAFNPGTAPTGFTYEAGPGGSLLVKQGGNTVLTITLDATNGDYSVVQNAPILHADGNLENNAIFSIGYTVTDIDLDSTPGTLTISIDDDVPTAIDDLARSVVEGAAPIGGNVLANDAQGADGATLTHVNLGSGMVAISSGTPVGDAFSFAVAGKGTYTFKADGSWTFTPSGNLNNATPTNAGFTYTITDADKDTSVAAQPITIEDGANPTSSKNAAITVNEEGLANANATGSVNNNSENGSDTVTFSAGSDNIVSVAFGDTAGITVNVNGIDGADIAWTAVGTTQIEGRIGGVLAITLTLVPPALPILAGAGGSATVNVALTDNFPHPNANGENTISLTGINVIATDTDNDTATATVGVTVIDDIARADDDAIGLTEGGPSFVNFDVDTNDDPGADGTGSRVFTSLTGTYGNITLNGDGTQTYTLTAAGQAAIDALPPGVTLTDTFSYTLTDGDGDSDPAQVVVTLTGTDDPVTITDLTPKANGGDAVVDEDDLPAGSDTAKESLTTPGDFTISAPDGVASLTVGGVLVVSNGVFAAPAPLVTPLGNTLTFTGYNPATGVVSYSYTLNAAETHPNANGQNNLFEDFPVVLTDADPVNPDVFNSTLSIQVIDDVPDAINDTDSIAAGTNGPATGNVITAVDVAGGDGNTTDGVIDVKGADGAAVSAISFGATTVNTFNGSGNLVIAGTYGTLTIKADGSYSYARTPGGNGGVSDTFTYVLRDGDGDTDTATLTINIGDATPVATANLIAVLDDDALSGGTPSTAGNIGGTGDTADNVNTSGILGASGGDGTLTRAFVTSGAPTGFTYELSGNNLLIKQGGVLVVTVTLNPTSGSYTVTQNAPILHASGLNENTQTFDIGYTVTDADGDVAPSNGVLRIEVNDDSPVNFTPQAALVVNDGVVGTGDAETFQLNFFEAVGSDRGTVSAVFVDTNLTDNFLYKAGTNTAVTAGGERIILSGYGTGVLVGRTETSNVEVVRITLNPSGTSNAADTYTVDFSRPIDDGSGVQLNTFSFVKSGNVDYNQLNDVSGVGPNKDLLFSATDSGSQDTVNTSTTGVGVANQSMNDGETLRIDFVNNLSLPGSGYDYDSHFPINNFQFALTQKGGGTANGTIDIFIRVYTANDDPDTANDYTALTNDALVADPTLVFKVNGVTTTSTFVAGKGYLIEGLSVNDVITTSNSAGYNRIEIDNSSGSFNGGAVNVTTGDSFDIGKFGFTIVGQGSNVALAGITVRGTDADGDTSTGVINITTTPAVAPPVVLDLDGDGAEFVSLSAGVTFDYAGDGSREGTAWVGPDDGLLAIDRNGDGIVNDGSEIVFARNGLTDLQGLAADYDSNDDGVLTAADDGYALFGVWQDANGNGVTDAGEFQSLTDAGIVSVGLVSDGIGYSAANGEVSVAGQAFYTKADGSTGIVADAAFATSASQSASRSSDQLRTSNVTSSIVAASLVGLAADAAPAVADTGDMRGTQMAQFDYQPIVSSFQPFDMASVHADAVQTKLAPVQDFAQHIGHVSTSLRAVDDPDSGFDMQDASVRQMSGLLGDSDTPTNASGHGSMAAIGSDMVMQHALDLAAFGTPAGANDNPAIPVDAGDVIRNALPDIMMDRLVDSFSGDVGSPGDSGADNVAAADALRGMLDVTIDSTHFSTMNNTDLLGSQQYEMATTNN